MSSWRLDASSFAELHHISAASSVAYQERIFFILASAFLKKTRLKHKVPSWLICLLIGCDFINSSASVHQLFVPPVHQDNLMHCLKTHLLQLVMFAQCIKCIKCIRVYKVYLNMFKFQPYYLMIIQPSFSTYY